MTEETKELTKAEERKRKVELSKERKKTENWLAAPEFSSAQKSLIRKQIAKDLNDDEFFVFLYRCRAYWLDPLKGEISVQVMNKKNPDKRQMVVVVQRDGYLTIAHRSGQFGGLKAGSKKTDGELMGWATVWNKSANQPTEIEVYESEYNPTFGWSEQRKKDEGWKYPIWLSKPRTMIQKVAESQALRKAFNISGVYDTAEVDTMKQIEELAGTMEKEIVSDEEKINKALAERARTGSDTSEDEGAV